MICKWKTEVFSLCRTILRCSNLTCIDGLCTLKKGFFIFYHIVVIVFLKAVNFNLQIKSLLRRTVVTCRINMSRFCNLKMDFLLKKTVDFSGLCTMRTSCN